METLGTGVTAEVKGSKVILTLDLSGSGTPSTSGKTMVIASTHGNQPVKVNGKVFKVGVNVFTKP